MKEKMHSFSVEDAKLYGVHKAIILQNLRFWLDKEWANLKRDEEDSGPKVKSLHGKTYVWTYNSAKAFAELFPYIPSRTISRYLLELEEEGAIVSGVFNKVKYDKTKWYSMPEYCISQNGQSESLFDESDGIFDESDAQLGEPIPDINSYINSDINTYSFGDSSNREIVPAKKERPKDLIWEALLSACGMSSEKLTTPERARTNKACKELKMVGASPEEIFHRAGIFKVLWPGIKVTPMGLVNHWSECEDNNAVGLFTSKARDKELDRLRDEENRKMQDEQIFRDMVERGVIDEFGNAINQKEIG